MYEKLLNMRLQNFPILLVLVLMITSCKDKPQESSNEQPQEERRSESEINMNTSSEKKSILFFGDSLTAGYGLEEEESFPSLIQNRIDSLGLDYQVINGGLSGETTAGGKGRIDWVLNKSIDIFILELGANDMLRGLSLVETDKNLRDILEIVKKRSPDVSIIIAGMEAPPNMGKEYMDSFRNIFHKLAQDYKAGLIPFLLSGLEGKSDMSIGDGKHPNAEGQKIVRENVWKVLEAYL